MGECQKRKHIFQFSWFSIFQFQLPQKNWHIGHCVKFFARIFCALKSRPMVKVNGLGHYENQYIKPRVILCPLDQTNKLRINHVPNIWQKQSWINKDIKTEFLTFTQLNVCYCAILFLYIRSGCSDELYNTHLCLVAASNSLNMLSLSLTPPPPFERCLSQASLGSSSLLMFRSIVS